MSRSAGKRTGKRAVMIGSEKEVHGCGRLGLVFVVVDDADAEGREREENVSRLVCDPFQPCTRRGEFSFSSFSSNESGEDRMSMMDCGVTKDAVSDSLSHPAYVLNRCHAERES